MQSDPQLSRLPDQTAHSACRITSILGQRRRQHAFDEVYRAHDAAVDLTRLGIKIVQQPAQLQQSDMECFCDDTANGLPG